MIAATFAKEQSLDLEAPEAVNLEEIENGAISVTLDKEAELRIDGEVVRVEELETWITNLMSERETQLVRLKIDKTLTKNKYGPVFAELSRAGAKIAIMGDNEE